MKIKRLLTSSVALFSAQQIKTIEQKYSANSAAGTFPLMENAGKVVFRELLSRWPQAKKIIIITGKGNNAGDGFIVARLAAEHRLKVCLCQLVDSNDLTGDALKAFKAIPIRSIKSECISKIDFSSYDVIVDAILGTGMKGKLSDDFLTAINSINANRVPVVSVDIPTGVVANTGFVDNVAVKADLTVSFVGHKKGMYTGDASNFTGQIVLDKLGVPSKYFDHQAFHLVTHTWQSIKHQLKRRELACHKGNNGHTTIIGGHKGMSGAAILSATAAARSGSGLISAWVSGDCVGALISCIPEVMADAIETTRIDEKIKGMIASLPNAGNTIVVGPGLGKSDWSTAWIKAISENELMRDSNQVWDADALNLLAEFPVSHVNYRNSKRVLTPHPGEAARLLQSNTYAISQDRFNAAQTIAEQYGGVCILKGKGTVIADDKGFQVLCPVGNPGMASGGMGDVLSGLIGGLLAQGHSLIDASILGVCIHGEAADLVAGEKKFYRGMLASDLFKYFPSLLNP